MNTFRDPQRLGLRVSVLLMVRRWPRARPIGRSSFGTLATNKRAATLSESTAELYSLVYTPGGSRVLAAGVDRSIRMWRLDHAEARDSEHSTFAHDAPIVRLAISADGTLLLASSAGDRGGQDVDARIRGGFRGGDPEAPGGLGAGGCVSVGRAAAGTGAIRRFAWALGCDVPEDGHGRAPRVVSGQGSQGAPLRVPQRLAQFPVASWSVAWGQGQHDTWRGQAWAGRPRSSYPSLGWRRPSFLPPSEMTTGLKCS